MKKLNHLRDIIQNYDLLIIDLWGVVHNGITPYPGAIKVIEELHKTNKNYYFLSNAPRPVKDVREFLLKKMKIKKEFLANILTSGEAAIISIKNFSHGKFFFHLGPERDKKIYEGMDDYKTELKKCDYILCTGLYDYSMYDLDYYKKLLQGSVDKKMICTNPDLIVDRGKIQEYCAGTIAEIFKKMGGTVIYFGKPYKEIYNMILKKKNRTLIIGDNLRTDIKGANLINQDSLFIANGVHRNEIDNLENLDNILKKYNVKVNFIQNELNW